MSKHKYDQLEVIPSFALSPIRRYCIAIFWDLPWIMSRWEDALHFATCMNSIKYGRSPSIIARYKYANQMDRKLRKRGSGAET